MKKFCSGIICILLVIILFLTGCTHQNAFSVKTVVGQDNQNIESLFDYFENIETDTEIHISAFKTIKSDQLNEIVSVNFSSEEEIYSAYDVHYDYDAEIIYLVVSIFDNNDNLISATSAEAYPIYYEDGTYDAQFDIEDKVVFLSEILSDKNEKCFFFSLTMSLLAAKIVAAAIVTAKVAAVVTGVVVIGYATYQVASLTKAKVQERERIAVKEKNKDNPRVYYPATRKDGKLLISAAPHYLSVAARNIVNNIDYWSPFDYTAKALAIRASGGYIGPEIDSNRDGYYYHYHLAGRIGGHSFYGTPYGGIY